MKKSLMEVLELSLNHTDRDIFQQKQLVNFHFCGAQETSYSKYYLPVDFYIDYFFIKTWQNSRVMIMGLNVVL